jgi:hypothetical protein
MVVFIIPVGGFLSRQFSPVSGPTFLDSVRCVGSESRLIECPANSSGSHSCSDAGVVCELLQAYIQNEYWGQIQGGAQIGRGSLQIIARSFSLA